MKITPPINIAIAEDNELLLNGTSMLLQIQPHFNVIIKALNGLEVISKIEKNDIKPDLCILDFRMPVLDGYETLVRIRNKWPKIKVLILSSYDHEHIIIRMLKAGAHGYLLKDSKPEILYNALLQIHAGQHYVSAEQLEVLCTNIELPSITELEVSFLKLCLEDIRYTDIANRLNLPIRNIEKIREGLFKKLIVNSRVGLVMYAIRNGIH